MINQNRPTRALIEGRAALVVIDIQANTFIDASEVRSIDNMPGYRGRMSAARSAINAARAEGIPLSWTGMRTSTALKTTQRLTLPLKKWISGQPII